MDITSIATLTTAVATAILAGATFYYAFTNHKLMLSRERELKKPRKIDELNSIIKPLITQCNDEIKSLENFPSWNPKRHEPFLEKIEQNNYKKIITKNFMSNNKELGKKIIYHDTGLKRFNDIFNELIKTMSTDSYHSEIKKMISKFNKQAKTRIAETDDKNISEISINHILRNTDINNNNLGEPYRSFWKRFGEDLLAFREHKDVQDCLKRLTKIKNDLQKENTQIIEKLEKLCDMYTEEYGISLDEELKDVF